MSGYLKRVRIIADFQFGRGAGKAIFPDGSEFLMSRTKRVRQITFNSERIATVRARDGLLTLSMDGAARLHSFLKAPSSRVVVMSDAVPFVREGKTAFARHVIEADPLIRASDEVLVVDEDDTLHATGQAALSAGEMLEFERGAAVVVRSGAGKADKTGAVE
ncbi:MAG: pseudouridine synthase [ANME-2 cluster archaeon]|nr:pseudouridine synthase [ANME-2 cluster archaeon]